MPKIRKHHGSWRVPYYVEIEVDGVKKKTRRFKSFNKKIDAEQFLKDHTIDSKGDSFAVSVEERMLIIQLRKEATKHHRPLISFADELMAAIRSGGDNTTSVEKAATAFLTQCAMDNLRPDSIEQHTRYVTEFANINKGRLLSSITRDEVLAFILTRYAKDESRNFVRTSLLAWLRWCENAKKWCSGWIPTLTWKRAKTDEKRISIPTPSEASTIIRNVTPASRIGVMLTFYTGIRPGEIAHPSKPRLLQWEDINFEERTIEILGEVSKVREYRLLSGLPRIVWDWLETVPEEERKGRIVPTSYTNFKKGRKKGFAAAGYLQIPKDIARHGFGSHAFHAIGVEMTIECLGHSETKTFFTHYKGATNEQRSLEYFSDFPDGACSPWPLTAQQIKNVAVFAVSTRFK